MIVVHSARLLSNQEADNWVAFDGQIKALGRGDTWREQGFQVTDAIDARGGFLSVALTETHTHGAAGFAAENGVEDIANLLDHLESKGIGRAIISLVSLTQQDLVKLVGEAAQLDHPRFLGLHLEGPYISTSRCGAHNLDAVRKPSDSELQELIAAGERKNGNVIASMTLAPEIFTSAQIETLVTAGVTICIGHTEASYSQSLELFEAGGRVLTHAFNAMPGIHHREPGPIPAAAEQQGVFLELICDGVHVDPSVAKLIDPAKVILVSDSMAAADLGDGEYELGGKKVSVVDGIARTQEGKLAGSTLNLLQAIKNYASWTGDPAAALRAVTTNPAAAYGLPPSDIAVGEKAELLLFDSELALVRQFGF